MVKMGRVCCYGKDGSCVLLWQRWAVCVAMVKMGRVCCYGKDGSCVLLW